MKRKNEKLQKGNENSRKTHLEQLKVSIRREETFSRKRKRKNENLQTHFALEPLTMQLKLKSSTNVERSDGNYESQHTGNKPKNSTQTANSDQTADLINKSCCNSIL